MREPEPVQWDPGNGRPYFRAPGGYFPLEELTPAHRRGALAFLSAEQLRAECDLASGESKRMAMLGMYDKAKRRAVVADELEEYIAAGGSKHR